MKKTLSGERVSQKRGRMRKGGHEVKSKAIT